VTGNITGGNILGGANVNATTHTGTTVSVIGNITGANINAGTLISSPLFNGTTVSIVGNVISNNIQNTTTISTTNATVSGQLVIPFFSSNPASPTAGSFYYNTAFGVLRFYNGAGWVNV
jgi:hypothetical protein